MEDITQEIDTGALARADMQADLQAAMDAVCKLRTSEQLATLFQHTRMLLLNRLIAEQQDGRATAPEHLSLVLKMSIEQLVANTEERVNGTSVR